MEIERAIRELLVIELAYHEEGDDGSDAGKMRLVEPYRLFVGKKRKDVVLLRAWQIDGFSQKGGLPDWRTLPIDNISDVRVLRTHFIPRSDRDAMLESLDIARTIIAV
jgi:predicted DNA-binding transcriptional regulator YafY